MEVDKNHMDQLRMGHSCKVKGNLILLWPNKLHTEVWKRRKISMTLSNNVT